MEDNYYASVDNKKMYINYFDALYLLNIVFKKNKEYEFIDKSHVESIWNSIDYKYHKFCVIKGFEYELGGYEVQIGDEYKGVCEKLIPKDNSNITYNPLTFDENPDFKKSYWKRRNNALNTFTEGDEFLNENYYTNLIFPLHKDTFLVNSWHHQGLKDIAQNIKIIARSYDGLPEAAIMDTASHPFMIAVQFHPERLGKDNGIHQQMRSSFFNAIYN